ncbi:MAG: hypothetical protein OEY28_11925 [Nitrospira sp.]|nr:hypothetical protein [Nitrospira sp.]
MKIYKSEDYITYDLVDDSTAQPTLIYDTSQDVVLLQSGQCVVTLPGGLVGPMAAAWADIQAKRAEIDARRPEGDAPTRDRREPAPRFDELLGESMAAARGAKQ